MKRKTSHDTSFAKWRVSCSVGQESGKFEVQFFVGSSLVKSLACV